MEKLRQFAQTADITFESWLASFFGIILVRALFEQFSSFQTNEYILLAWSSILHGVMFYLVTIIAIMTILLYFGKTSFKEVAVFSLFGFMLIWLPPIVDLITSGVGGHVMGYLFLPAGTLALRYLTFFGGQVSSSITLGIQIEILLGIIFCFAYVFSATKKISRAIAGALVFYTFVFFIVSVPSLIAILRGEQAYPLISIAQSIGASHLIQNNLHPNFTASSLGLLDFAFDKLMIGVNIIFSIVALCLLFYLGARKKFIAFLKNSRPERIFHYFLLFLFGSSFIAGRWFGNWIDVLMYALAFLAIAGAWLFSVCQNDIYDQKIDEISNQNRPLPSMLLSREDMNLASKILLILTFGAAYAAGGYAMFFTALYLLVYFIYSNPPLRLKRFVGVSSFLISLASLSAVMAGFFQFSVNKNIIAFPPSLALAIIILFTVVANLRDIKDAEGDRAAGIKTLPVLLGLKKSKMLIGGAIAFFSLLIPWYFDLAILFIPAIIAAALSWYFINQENYQEWKVFAVYMTYLILIIAVMILK